MRAFWTTAIICRIRELRRSLCSASGWRKAAKLLDELGEMLELTDDFLGAFARLEDFSPLVASAEAKPSATTIRKHESEIKKEGGIRP